MADKITDVLKPQLNVFDELQQLGMFAMQHDVMDQINRKLVDLQILIEGIKSASKTMDEPTRLIELLCDQGCIVFSDAIELIDKTKISIRDREQIRQGGAPHG